MYFGFLRSRIAMLVSDRLLLLVDISTREVEEVQLPETVSGMETNPRCVIDRDRAETVRNLSWFNSKCMNRYVNVNIVISSQAAERLVFWHGRQLMFFNPFKQDIEKTVEVREVVRERGTPTFRPTNVSADYQSIVCTYIVLLHIPVRAHVLLQSC